MSERTVADNRNLMFRAPGQNRVFDRPLLQMIENLVAGDLTYGPRGPRILQIRNVEIADAPR